MGRNVTGAALIVSMKEGFEPSEMHGNSVGELWAVASKALILQAEGKCSKCGKHLAGLVVHHKDGCPLNNSRVNLEVLCKSCHRTAHTGKYYKPAMFNCSTPGRSSRQITHQSFGH